VIAVTAPVSVLEKLRAAVKAAEGSPFAHVRYNPLAGAPGGLMEGVGVVDFRAWRCAVDFGAFALVFDQGRLWQGASGSRLSELGDPLTPWAPTPLTLVAFAEAAVDATETGTEVIAGEEHLRLAAIADLGALPASHRPLPMPPEVLPDPGRVPFDAFLTHSGSLRRLRWQSAYQPSSKWKTWEELDFVGLADSIEVDWTRMPVYQPLVDDDLEATPEEIQLAERLVDLIERMGPPEEETPPELEEELRLLTEDLRRLEAADE
jgi:hypothetical protein